MKISYPNNLDDFQIPDYNEDFLNSINSFSLELITLIVLYAIFFHLNGICITSSLNGKQSLLQSK